MTVKAQLSAEGAALHAVIDDDPQKLQELLADMLPGELADLRTWAAELADACAVERRRQQREAAKCDPTPADCTITTNIHRRLSHGGL